MTQLSNLKISMVHIGNRPIDAIYLLIKVFQCIR